MTDVCVREKYLGNGKDAYWAFRIWERPMVRSNGTWQILRLNGWRKIVESGAEFLRR